jgi:DNA replication and repair protein RecF
MRGRMLLRHLSLTNFRNFTRLDTDLPPGHILVVGANAQGKSSLLEAIAFLSSASSVRTNSDRQLVNFLAAAKPSSFARLSAEVQRGGLLQRVEIRLIVEEAREGDEGRLRKEILINGVKRRAADLFAGVNVVMFQPHDLVVVEGPPAERRRYLDHALMQAGAGYGETLHEYNRVVTQRNALLRSLQDSGAGNGQLDFWDEQLADLGATLLRARLLALAELERLASPQAEALTRKAESLRLTYLPSMPWTEAAPAQLDLLAPPPLEPTTIPIQQLRQRLLQALQQRRSEEIARAITLTGPHRDDFCFSLQGMDLRMYGSRGQNRTAMLALKLAEAGWLYQRTHEHPVLLLDEVLAELDPQRREDLIEHLAAVEQALITSADVSMFPPAFLARATLWQIEAGRLTQQAS